MKAYITVILIIMLTACGSNPHRVAAIKVGDEYYKPDASAAMAIDTGSKEKIVCERRIVTGSHRKQKTCSTVSQKERERRAAQETARSRDLFNSRLIVEEKGGGG